MLNLAPTSTSALINFDVVNQSIKKIADLVDLFSEEKAINVFDFDVAINCFMQNVFAVLKKATNKAVGADDVIGAITEYFDRSHESQNTTTFTENKLLQLRDLLLHFEALYEGGKYSGGTDALIKYFRGAIEYELFYKNNREVLALNVDPISTVIKDDLEFMCELKQFRNELSEKGKNSTNDNYLLYLKNIITLTNTFIENIGIKIVLQKNAFHIAATDDCFDSFSSIRSEYDIAQKKYTQDYYSKEVIDSTEQLVKALVTLEQDRSEKSAYRKKAEEIRKKFAIINLGNFDNAPKEQIINAIKSYASTATACKEYFEKFAPPSFKYQIIIAMVVILTPFLNLYAAWCVGSQLIQNKPVRLPFFGSYQASGIAKSARQLTNQAIKFFES